MAISSARVSVPRELRLGHPAALIGIATCVLTALGMVMILSASSVTSFANYGSSFLFFKKQLLGVVIGAVGFILFCRLDYRRLKGFGYPAYMVALLLLVAVLIPGVGVISGGSSRWLSLGPMSFQPSEFAKLALILFSADVLARKREHLLGSVSHTLVPVFPALALFAGLVILQPDLGTTLLLCAIGLGHLFVAGSPIRQLAPLGVLAIAVGAFGAMSADYRRARILAFLDPWADPLNTGYQTIQSLIALGSGGWVGVGLGASRQKWSYIPNAHTDFIFAILGEETGLLGTAAVLGMFAFIAYVGVRTARRAPDRFGTLVAAGITIWISLQALINIGAATASLPITGVPLPLVSFGGSSLVVLLVSMGILTNIAVQGERAAVRRAERTRR